MYPYSLRRYSSDTFVHTHMTLTFDLFSTANSYGEYLWQVLLQLQCLH